MYLHCRNGQNSVIRKKRNYTSNLAKEQHAHYKNVTVLWHFLAQSKCTKICAVQKTHEHTTSFMGLQYITYFVRIH